MISAMLPSGRPSGFKKGSVLVFAALGSSRRRKMPASLSMVVCGGTSAFSSHMMIDSGWSRRFSPTPGRFWMTGMPRSLSCSWGPMPERSISLQVSTAPAQRMVSAFGETVSLVPDFKVRFTPVTVLPETLILLTQALVKMVKLGRFS